MAYKIAHNTCALHDMKRYKKYDITYVALLIFAACLHFFHLLQSGYQDCIGMVSIPIPPLLKWSYFNPSMG